MSQQREDWNAVTGASGYSGRYITQQLLSIGEPVRTLVRQPERGTPFGSQVPALRLQFDNVSALTESLRGAKTLYNTYWVRFEHGTARFAQAVENTRCLLQAAKAAGVRRVVHLSVSNPDLDSRLPYFSGKALVEEDIRRSGLSYAILRPTLIYGHDDILVNNIAWCLRRFPVFAVPGSGKCKLQPVFIEDLTRLAVQAAQRDDNFVADAVGPETFTFEEFVRGLAHAINSRALIIHAPPSVSLAASQLVGLAVGDVMLTRDELDGLMANLLISADPPTCQTRFSQWLMQNANGVGTLYASELRRHFHR